MNRPALLVVGLLAGVVTLVFWRFPDQNIPASPDSVTTSDIADAIVTPTSTRVGTEQSASVSQPPSAPANDRQFAELRPELERQAMAGDGHAAWRLGTVLANCNGYVAISDAKLEDSVVNDFATGLMKAEATPDAKLQRLKLQHAQRRRDCGNATGLSESDTDNAANKKAFHWMELGASLGDADAQAMYPSLAFEVFDGRNALANAELIRERKRLALDYLNRALAQGNALALHQFSKAYTDGLLFPPDAESAYRYLYAFSLTSRANDYVPGFLELALSSGAQGLAASALARAQEAGRRVANCCMTGVQE